MAKRIADMSTEEAEAHRAARREMYSRDPERQRLYSKAHRLRKAKGTGTSLKPPRPHYDPTDYAEEWRWLTEAGVLSIDIIEKSTPSKAWFKKHITPIVKYANCPGCKRKYLVRRSGTLLICGKDCPRSSYLHTFAAELHSLELTNA